MAISPQGLDERFNETAANCLRRILEEAMDVVIESSPQVIPILQRFSGIFVQDSTSLQLLAELAERWKAAVAARAVKPR